MNLARLAIRSLRHAWRINLATGAAVAVTTAVLVGALLVGDSVRGTLRAEAMLRIGQSKLAMAPRGRFFRAELADDLARDLDATAAAALRLSGQAKTDAGTRANDVRMLGVDADFWALSPGGGPPPRIRPGEMCINAALAERLEADVGDELLLRIENPSVLPRDATFSGPAPAQVAARLRIAAVLDGEQFGQFSLSSDPGRPFVGFLPLGELQRLVHRDACANVLLLGGRNVRLASARAALERAWTLADAELRVRRVETTGEIELTSDRILLDRPVVRAAADIEDAVGILTWLVNDLASDGVTTPYSMVAGLGPLDPNAALSRHALAGLDPNGLVPNRWLADDLGAAAGDRVRLSYYVPARGGRLRTDDRTFTVRRVVPLKGPYADRSFMPDFPGLEEAETTRDWQPGIPIDLDRIREKDERYWRDHRGTPKAFVTLDAAREMWASRFGDLTAVRWPAGRDKDVIATSLRDLLDPVSLGLAFRPVRSEALAAAERALDLGQIFLGLSFYLLAAALLLTALLFALEVQRRHRQIGTLLAVGFAPRRVAVLLLLEAAPLAVVGGLIGLGLGVLYTRALLAALSGAWRGAVAGWPIRLFVSPGTLGIAYVASVMAALAAIGIALVFQLHRPARALLAGERPASQRPSRRRLARTSVAAGAIFACVLLAWLHRREVLASVAAFFVIGGGLLIALLFASSLWASGGRATGRTWLALRSAQRSPGRSRAVTALVAIAAFLLLSMGLFRLSPPGKWWRRDGGTGGFALIAETAIPIVDPLIEPNANTADTVAPNVTSVSLRVREGDDASCLNLDRAQQPRLLGVRPEQLADRGAFEFTQQISRDKGDGWSLLQVDPNAELIPAVGDEPTVKWGLGLRPGDTLAYTDSGGGGFRIRIVGVIASSILQGSLLISEDAFLARYPNEEGYGAFLIDVKPRSQRARETAARQLRERWSDYGLAVMPTERRLARFQTVQNTYLTIFQALGALGMLLGTAALTAVIARNVMSRRGELALMLAVGFERSHLRRMLILEHTALVAWGLVVALLSAGSAAGIVVGSRAWPSQPALLALGAVLIGLLALAFAWSGAATHLATRGRLLKALREE